ncbi:MAG: cytochrome c [Alcanivoracaceae bacterium]|nr:cytochrome c [Alcanivoracaceae bacterium]
MNKQLRALLGICFLVVGLPAGAEEKQCPQPRFTGQAPTEYLIKENPLKASRSVLGAGKRLYLGKVKGSGPGCAVCHGSKGDGQGPLAASSNPPPRDFTCAQTINGIPDGQLFWIIRHGSPETSMPAHPQLDDQQIWQLVHVLRRLAR